MRAESQGKPNRNGEPAAAAGDDKTLAVSSVSGHKESEWVLGAATQMTHAAEGSKGTTSFMLLYASVVLLRVTETGWIF